MNHFHTTLLYCALICASTAKAQSISYKPNSMGSFRGYFIAKGNYEDIRVDDRDNKKIRYWGIRKGNVRVDQFFKSGKLQTVRFREFNASSVKDVIYERRDSIFELKYARSRPFIVSNYEGIFRNEADKMSLCQSKSSSLKQVLDLGKSIDSDLLQNNFESKIIDPSCKKEMSEEQYNSTVDSLVLATIPNNEFIKCLNSDNTAQVISTSMKDVKKEVIKEELNLLGLKYSLEMEKYFKHADSLKGKVTCKSSDKSKPIAQCIDQNKIIFFFSKGAKNAMPSSRELAEASTHEILHTMDFLDENTVANLTNICYQKATKVSFNSNLKAMGIFEASTSMVPTTDATTMESAGTVANVTEVKVPKSLAETAIPSAQSSEIDQPFVDETKQRIEYANNKELAESNAYAGSVRATWPILNFANKVLSVSPAQATSLALRGTASLPTSGFGNNGPSARRGTTKPASKDDDYEIKEEILTSASGEPKLEVAPKAPAAIKDNVRGTFVPNRNGDVSAESGAASVSGGSVAASSGAGRSGLLSSSGRGADRSPSSVAASVASEARSKATAVSSLNSEQIKSVLRNYRQAKAQMKEPKFIKALKDNKITVLDMTGNSLGASSGEIIYMDTGTNYVRQK